MTKIKHQEDFNKSWIDLIKEIFCDPLQKDTVIAVASTAFLDANLERLITTFLVGHLACL